MDPVVAAALITTHTTVHGLPHSTAPVAKAEKVKRPCISSAGTTEDGQYFTFRWSEVKLSGTDKVIQLLECCDDQLRRDLSRSTGETLVGNTEVEVLAAMKILAVREENIMVARVTLHKIEVNLFTLMGLDFEGKQVYVNFCDNVQTVKLMWTIQRRYFEMCYVRDWRTQRYNLNY